MFKIHMLLFYYFIYVSIQSEFVNCAPRFKRISNEEIQKNIKKDVGNKTAIQKTLNISNLTQTTKENKNQSLELKITNYLNSIPKKGIQITDNNIKEDEHIRSICENVKPDIEVILLDNIPKSQEISPLFNILSDDVSSSYEQNPNQFLKWIKRQENKSPHKRTLEFANMLLGLGGLDEMSMDYYPSEYFPFQKRSIMRNLEVAPLRRSQLCPIHVLKTSPVTEKNDVLEKSKEYVKICTCSVIEKPNK